MKVTVAENYKTCLIKFKPSCVKKEVKVLEPGSSNLRALCRDVHEWSSFAPPSVMFLHCVYIAVLVAIRGSK